MSWPHFGELREQLQRGGATDWQEVCWLMEPSTYVINGAEFETPGKDGWRDAAAVSYVNGFLEALPIGQRPARWFIGSKRIGAVSLAKKLSADLGDAMRYNPDLNGPTVCCVPLWISSGSPADWARRVDLRRPMRHTRDLAMRRALDTIPSQEWRGHYDAILRADKKRRKEEVVLLPWLVRALVTHAVTIEDLRGPQLLRDSAAVQAWALDNAKLNEYLSEFFGTDALLAARISTWWTRGFVRSDWTLDEDVYRVASELGNLRDNLYQEMGGWPAPPALDVVEPSPPTQQQLGLFGEED